MKELFQGTGVALVTPFNEERIDYRATRNLIERDIKLGAKALIILATTGEGCTISDREREKFIRFCIKENCGRAKIIVGTGNNNFSKCFDLTLQASRLGADGVLVVTPYYNKTTQKGLIEFYDKLSRVKIPMILYNVPSRTGLNIELDTLEKIIDSNEYVWGIKESTTDIARIKNLCYMCKDKIAVYSGEDGLNYLFYCLGASGCVSVTANAYPDRVEEIFNHVKSNNFSLALSCQERLDKINDAMFYETNPIPIKYYLSLMGLTTSKTRMPLTSLTEINKKRINSLYERTLQAKIKGDT